MNKFCVKVAALCLSAAMFTSAFAVPSLWNAGTVADVVSAATEKNRLNFSKIQILNQVQKSGLHIQQAVVRLRSVQKTENLHLK